MGLGLGQAQQGLGLGGREGGVAAVGPAPLGRVALGLEGLLVEDEGAGGAGAAALVAGGAQDEDGGPLPAHLYQSPFEKAPTSLMGQFKAVGEGGNLAGTGRGRPGAGPGAGVGAGAVGRTAAGGRGAGGVRCGRAVAGAAG